MLNQSTENKNTPASPRLLAKQIKCGLRDKVFGYAGTGSDKHWRAVLLTTGDGQIETGDDVIPMSAPCLAWVPWRPGHGIVRGKSTGQNWPEYSGFQATRLRHSANEAARLILKSCRLRK